MPAGNKLLQKVEELLPPPETIGLSAVIAHEKIGPDAVTIRAVRYALHDLWTLGRASRRRGASRLTTTIYYTQPK